MKRFSKCGCFLLAIVIMMSFPVSATEEVESRSSSFFGNFSVYLDEVDDFNFAVCFRVTGIGIMEKIGACKIQVQISEDGENWATTQTYTMEDHPEFIRSNAATHAHDFNYNGSRGFHYRAIIQLYAKNSTGTAKLTRYTSAIVLGD